MSETPLPLNNLETSLEKRIADRQALLDTFADQPLDDTVWESAFSKVMADGDYVGGSAFADALPAAELIEMATLVRSTPISARYNLMAGQASNGQLWFDVMQGFSSTQIRSVQTELIRSWLDQGDSPMQFDRALDVGTGVGKSLATLQANAQTVVGLDRNAALIDIAKARAANNTLFVQASVDALPFDNDSFDLITSLGLECALDRKTAIGFYSELGRVMMPDGIYITSSYYTPEGEQPSDELASFALTSKAMLSDMIGDTVTGALDIRDRITPEAKETLLHQLGLHEYNYDITSDDGTTHNLVTVVTKNSTIFQ
jgi:ubiquinone/menaquinone biosynthesis C-methylase UbiE